MSTEVRWRRGTAAEHAAFTGALSEITHNTTTNRLHVHDGVTPGGFPQGGGGSGTQDVVANITALKAVDKNSVTSMRTAGYTTPGDGGSGNYKMDLADTTTADNGATVIVGTDGGRWKLEHTGSILAEQCGIVADGSTNMQTRLQAALNIVAVREVVFGKGTYAISGTVTVPFGKTLRGIIGRGTAVQVSGSSDVFVVNGQSMITGFTFYCDTQTAGYLVVLNTANNGVEYFRLEDVVTWNSKGIMVDGNHATNVATNITVNRVSARLHKGRGFYLRDAFAFLEFRDVLVDHVGNATAQNFVGYEIVNCEGNHFFNVEFTGSFGLPAGASSAQDGFRFVNCKAVYLDRIFSDVAGGFGIYFSGCQFVRAIASTASINNGSGIYISNCTDVQMTNMYVAGRKGIAGSAASVNAMMVEGGSHIRLSDLEILNATGSGFVSVSAPVNLVVSGSFHDNNVYGYTTNTGTGGTLVHGSSFRGNTTGAYALAQNTDFIQSSMNGTALLNVTGPGSA